MPFISSIDNEKIYYEVLGYGDISLVFIGGWLAPTGRELWKYQIKFASEYKIILIDLSGYGKSDMGRKIHTMQLYGQDVKAVIEDLDLKDNILIGFSMGGAVILEAEKLIPERTIGLIPIDALRLDSMYTSNDEEKINIFMKPFEENFIEEAINLMKSLISDKFDPQDVMVLEKAIHTMDENSMNSALRELYKWDFRDILPEIEKPIKCIGAGRTLPSKEQRDLYSKIFDTVFIEGIGHVMFLEDPERFNVVLDKRIRELR